MKRTLVTITLSLIFLLCSSAGARGNAVQSGEQQDNEPAATAPQQSAGVPQAAVPAQGPGKLTVLVGRSLVVDSPETLARVSVTNPDIATAVIVSPKQVLIHGVSAGSITLVLWNENNQPRSFDLEVDLDVDAVRTTMRQVFPNENIQAGQSGNAIVLTGTVSNKAVADQAVMVAQSQTKNVVNLLTYAAPGARQMVSLQVRFAEVDRTVISQYGFNLFSNGATNTFGVTGTGQFGSASANVGSLPAGTSGGGNVGAPNAASGGTHDRQGVSPGVIGLSDLLNIFIFRPDLNLGATIKALQQRNLLQVLAEPNILALNGVEASFLAGGEFPFPVVQGGTSFTSVTIQFKEFGVRLKFTPEILDGGNVRLRVAPEVSALDFSNALQISGFTVPAISTRRTETQIELHDGQSFAIAGLMDNRTTEIASKIPVLGDIPIIGHLFRSRATNRTNNELLVVVTPRLVPIGAGGAQGPMPAQPVFPEEFLNQKKFDQGSYYTGGKSTTQSAPAAKSR